MSGDLDLLWIITNKGLCLLQHSFNDEEGVVDKNIFTGFVTALLDFSDNVFSDSLDKITMGKQNLYCMPFSRGQFYVVISAKREADEKMLTEKIRKVGLAFAKAYGSSSENVVFFEDQFKPFTKIVNNIFETKAITVTKENEQFLKIIQVAEKDNLTESETVENILVFFEKLPIAKQQLLLQTTLSTLTIFTESKNLSYEQLKRFEKIFSGDKF